MTELLDNYKTHKYIELEDERANQILEAKCRMQTIG